MLTIFAPNTAKSLDCRRNDVRQRGVRRPIYGDIIGNA
jgi:hypothetical protein